MTDMDQSHVPRAVSTMTEMVALQKLLECQIEALDRRLSTLNETGLATVRVADEATRRDLMERIEGVRRELLLIQDAAHRAIEKAEAAQSERNKQQNEWRQTVTELVHRTTTPQQLDQVRQGLTVVTDATDKRVDKLEEWKNVEQGQKQSRQILLPIMVGVIVFILTQVARVMFPIIPPERYERPAVAAPAPAGTTSTETSRQ